MDKHLFVSYQRENAEFAENLMNRLEKAGFKVWVDSEKLHAGRDWRAEIDQAIKNAFAFIVVMTPEAKASEYVTYEWSFAWGAGIKVIPILLKPTQLHPRLESLQYLNFIDYPTRPWDKLTEALKGAVISQTVDDNLLSQNFPFSPEVIKAASFLVAAMKQDQDKAQIHVSNTEQTQEAAGKIDQLVTPEASRQLSAASVLWVDDNPTNNIYERQALEALGMRFTLSISTQDAIEKVQSNTYDVIISDMGRPPDQRAGYTLLGKLKELGVATPFIIYAGSRLPEHVAEARRNGAFGTTNDPQELFELVVNAIKG